MKGRLRLRSRRPLLSVGAATLAASLAVALSPATAAAVDQSPKNGCTSPQDYRGALTSPSFNSPSPVAQGASPQVRFKGWFEAESVAPGNHDEATMAYSINNGFPVEFARLIDSAPPNSGGSDDVGYSNNGTGQAPTFESYSFALPPEAQGQTGVRIHFQFATGDAAYNGFRGFAVDDVSIDTTGSPLAETFENSSATAWTFDPAAGPGAPFWHILNNPQNTRIKSPEINPDLVTLAQSDSGALPAAAEGTRVAWFGDDASGTYCGPDFANRVETQPPETTITGGPPDSTSSTDASFEFVSSEAESSFECQLDGGGFAPCSAPQSYTGLSPGNHTFEVRATDPVGNIDPTPASRTWTVDPAPPETTITGGPPGSTTSTSASLAFTSSEAGSSFQCRLDGGGFEPCFSPHSLLGLSEGAHTFEVRATDAAGNVDPTPAARSWTVVVPEGPPLTLADLPKPALGEEVNVQALSGKVLIGVPTAAASGAGARASQRGVRFVPLSEARQIPVGSLLDVRKGKVRLQSARDRRGTRQNGDFSGGVLRVRQSKQRKAKGLTVLDLQGPRFASCKTRRRVVRRGRRATTTPHAWASRRKPRRTSANTRGRFGTRGNESSATARGTKWTMTDSCKGTLTKVTRGTVVVRDFRRRKTIIVKAGKSYLAKARR